MRAASHANGKDLAKEIALLKAQLEELTDSMSGTGHSYWPVARKLSKRRSIRLAS